jgi:orotate phosphoribosyltransferase
VILGDGQPCLIAIPTAATAIAVAASLCSVEHHTCAISVPFCDEHHHTRYPLLARVMREGRKEHGANRGWVNGKPSPNHTYWLFDNVVTEGGSIFDALSKLDQDGYQTANMPILVVVDRERGGFNTLRAQGFERLYSCYKLRDIVFALVEHRLWPRDYLKILKNELQLPVTV